MWTNRISRLGLSTRFRLVEMAAAAAPAAVSCAPLVSPGAFVAPPAAGFQPGLYDLARRQAAFELKQRRRRAYVSVN